MQEEILCTHFEQFGDIYCGECLDTLKSLITFQDLSQGKFNTCYPIYPIDLVVSDLPYGVTKHPDDKPIDLKQLWNLYDHILKPNAAIALFCQGLFFVDLVNSNRKYFRYDLVWDKVLTSGHLNANRMPLRVHEQVALFYKKQPTYNPQYYAGKPLHSKGNSYKHREVTNNNYGKFNALEDYRAGSTEKYPHSILKFQKPHPSKALHRTEKPVECIEWLIKTYSNEGDLVLDNASGSGSVAIACINTKRRFILIEKSVAEYNKSVKRIENHINTTFKTTNHNGN